MGLDTAGRGDRLKALASIEPMATTRYRTVFLDAGGVMVTPNFPRLAEALARRGIDGVGRGPRRRPSPT